MVRIPNSILAFSFALIVIPVYILVLQFPPNFSGGDNYGLLFDALYREGFQAFNFKQLTTNLIMDTYYSPIPTLLFNFLYKTFGINIKAFHTVAAIIHFMNALLVGYVALQLIKSKSASVMAGTIFLLHPENILTVSSWLSAALVHGLTMFFFLISLSLFIAFMRSSKLLLYAFSLICFLCACFCKLTAITLLPVIMLTDLLLFEEVFGRKRVYSLSKAETVLAWLDRFMPYLLIAIPFVLIALYRFPYGGVPFLWGGTAKGPFILCRVVDFMTWLLFPFYTSIGRPFYLVIITLSLVLFGLYRSEPIYKVLIAWTFLALFLFSIHNFRPLETLYKYLYLGSIPFSMLFSLAVINSFKCLKKRVESENAI